MRTEEQKAEEKRKTREGRILFLVFGTLITVLIAAMFFIDMYAQDHAPGARQVNNAADQ